MQTIKLPYYIDNNEDKTTVLSYIKQYSNCLRFMFNRVKDNISETQIKHLTINNVDLLDSWFKQSCVKEAIQINNTNGDKKVIFGGKANFLKRVKGNITKEEFKLSRLSPLYSIGEGSNPGVKGNRKFHIEQDIKTITFKPNRDTKINLILPNIKQNYINIFKKLYILQEGKATSISYKLDLKYIYISFDENKLCDVIDRDFKVNRVMAIDLNPNYIGWSVTDWKSENDFTVIKSGVYSLKHLNDKERELKSLKLNSSNPKRIYINNKRTFETLEISKDLINKALHYKVELFSLEDLNIKSSDKGRGGDYNKLCNNQWIRNTLVNNLTKRCNLYKIKILSVKANYSSFIGNFIYRGLKLPDMVLSSIEVGRRGYEFNCQYIKKIKEVKKNIIIPSKEFYEDLIVKSLEEFNIKDKFDTLVDLYLHLKNTKIKYRVSLEKLSLKFCSHNQLKYGIIYT